MTKFEVAHFWLLKDGAIPNFQKFVAFCHVSAQKGRVKLDYVRIQPLLIFIIHVQSLGINCFPIPFFKGTTGYVGRSGPCPRSAELRNTTFKGCNLDAVDFAAADLFQVTMINCQERKSWEDDLTFDVSKVFVKATVRCLSEMFKVIVLFIIIRNAINHKLCLRCFKSKPVESVVVASGSAIATLQESVDSGEVGRKKGNGIFVGGDEFEEICHSQGKSD